MDLSTLKQVYLDSLAPKPKLRWGVVGVLILIYILRIFSIQSFYLITYCLGIYLIHGLILFLTPKGENISDPFESYEDASEYMPPSIDNEFRPFIRNMPEFDFWQFTFKIILVSFLATFIDCLDIPVFTPILVFYFFFMVVYTCRCLYLHMKKYNYNPFFQAKDYYKD